MSHCLESNVDEGFRLIVRCSPVLEEDEFVLNELLIVAGVVAILWSFPRFRTMSRELDESVLMALKRIMRVSEDHGYPPTFIPILMLLTAFSFMLSLYVTTLYGR